MSKYAKSQINLHPVSSTSPQRSFVELLRSLSQRVHPFWWHVNGDADHEDALHKFLNIEHSQYLLVMENCGYGDNVTKGMTVELAEAVGKAFCEFSEYTVRKSTSRSQRNYIRLGCKVENTNEIPKRVKNQLKKGKLMVFPKKLIHTCRLNKNELRQLTSIQEFHQFQNKYRHIVYSNRQHVPKMEPVKGTQQLHAVSSCQGDRDGSNEKLRKLQIAIKPCSCLKCR